MRCTVCITFISYFDKIKSSAKKQTERLGNEILTCRPNSLSQSRTVAPPLKQSPIAKVCVREIESDREKHLRVCVSENTSVQLSVLEWEMINLSKGLHRGRTIPNLGSVTDWVNMKTWAIELLGKISCEYFFTKLKKKNTAVAFPEHAFFSPWFNTFITCFSHQ